MTSKIIKVSKNIGWTMLGMLFIGWVILWDLSPGTVAPILDEKGYRLTNSISEQSMLSINGTKQHLTIRGEDSTKQVMLFLHGGPGNSMNEGLRNPDLILEKEFVVVQWDQLGAGRSYNTSINKGDLKIDSLIAHAVEVTKYLCQRFNQEKIHVMGISWGTHLGMLLVNEHPEWYYSYTGVAQTINVYEAEKMGFEWVKQQAILRADKKGIAELSKISIPETIINLPEWNDQFGWTYRSYLNKYGGILFGQEVDMVGGLLFPLLTNQEYTILQKINCAKGLLFSLEATWEERLTRALPKEIDSIQVPIIIVQGLHDYNTPHALAKQFFDQLPAPYKRFYTFEKSAHAPHQEETEKFNQVIVKELLDTSFAVRN